MTSWLNTASITNLAKNALKEAQKTIDKALDIRETDIATPGTNYETKSNEVGQLFFQTSNLIKETEKLNDSITSAPELHDVVIKEPCSGKEAIALLSEIEDDCKNLNKETYSAESSEVGDFNQDENKAYNYIGDSNSNDSSTSTLTSRIKSHDHYTDERDNGKEMKNNASSDVTNSLHNPGKNQDDVSTMLSEAMKDSVKTETSTSASGDEIETTTSSDIEIIASPSTCIRNLLPSVVSRSNEVKTHSREPSEASSSDSTTGQEVELNEMKCKMIQLNQLLEARDNKQHELARKTSALTEEVEKLKSLLAIDEKERSIMSEAMRRQTDDFAVRLSSVEKRYQQTLAERDALSKKVEQFEQSFHNHGNLLENLRDKDETINQLRFEGEKLSKLHLHQSNLIKKLRTQEKEDDIRCKQLRDDNEELKSENIRLTKCLSVKDEIEKNQIETVKTLTTSNNELEKELTAIKMVMREKLSEIESLKALLVEVEQNLAKERASAASRDSAETERFLSVEVSLRQSLQLEYAASTRQIEEETQALRIRCQELIQSLAEVDGDRLRERQRMQNEISQLMNRLQETESRNDELSQALTTATKPLLRRIDTLQQALTSQRLMQENSEKALKEKLDLLRNELLLAVQTEGSNKVENLRLQAQIKDAKEQTDVFEKEKKQLLRELEEEKTGRLLSDEARKRDNFTSDLVKSQLIEDIKRLQQQVNNLERNVELQTIALEQEKIKSTNEKMDQLHDKDIEYQTCSTVKHSSGTKSISEIVSRSSSPTPSLGKLSLSGSFTESHSSNPWNTDEVFDGGFVTPVPKSTLYDTMRAGSYAAVYESLQAQLKTRDGEVAQLQQDLQNQEKTRDSLTKELTEIIKCNQELINRLDGLEQLRTEYEDLEKKYNALLQMYGEKIEESEELRLDLVDVKEMYKAQIDQLMKM